MLGLSLVVVLVFAFAWGNYGLSRLLGAPTLLFIALAALTLFFSVVLIYLPKSFDGPSLTALPFVLFFASAQWGWNHNHVISSRPEALTPAPIDPRPKAAAHFRQWDKEHGNADAIILVAAEGGASRSAWWTAYVLGSADFATDGEFTKHLYAISGVSGGSVGAAAFTALLARRSADAQMPVRTLAPRFPVDGDCARADVRGTRGPLATQAACLLGRDMTSPVLGYMLYPDLVQRFLPLPPILSWDRSLGLEHSWTRDWRGLFGSNAFGEPLSQLYQAAAPANGGWRTDLPVLLLNTTRANAGRLAVESSVRLKPGDDVVDDLFRLWPAALNLPLAAIVHNSARFPIVSPGGEIYADGASKKQYVDALVDGGYFENSGANGLLKLLQSIEADYSPEEWKAIRQRMAVVFIENTPPAPGSTSNASGCYEWTEPAFPIAQEELLTPLKAFYQARSARAPAARADLIQYLTKGLDDRGAHVGIHVPLESREILETPPSMNWYMSTPSRRRMWASLTATSCSGDRLGEVFARIDPGKSTKWQQRLASMQPAGIAPKGSVP